MPPVSRRSRHFAVAGLLVLMQAVLLVAIMGSQREQVDSLARRNALEQLQDLSRRVADSTSLYLEGAERAVQMLAEHAALGGIDAGDDAGLERAFIASLRATPPLAGIYIGRSDGSFHYVSRTDDGFRTKTIRLQSGRRLVRIVHRDRNLQVTREEFPAGDEFDPRQRPWYRRAIELGRTAWTDPYVFYTDQRPGVTVATPIGPAGSQDVFGADIELAGMSVFVASIPVSRSGYAMILDNRLAPVAEPAPGATRPAPQAGTNGGARTAAIIAGMPPVLPDTGWSSPLEIDGVVHHAVARPFAAAGTIWRIVVVAPETDFSPYLQAQFYASGLRIVAVTVAGAIALLALSWSMRRPMLTWQRHATTDAMTGLPNRQGFLANGRAAIGDLRSTPVEATVAMLDLDGFKRVNDRFGHDAGDQVLQAVAGRLRGALRPGDLIGRHGGDEFTLLVFGGPQVAVAAIDRIVAAIASTPIATAAGRHDVGATVGVSRLRPGETLEEALTRADRRLIAEKRRQRDSGRQPDDPPTTRAAPAGRDEDDSGRTGDDGPLLLSAAGER